MSFIAPALLAIAAAAALGAAFAVPFLYAEFRIAFPDWIPDWLGLHAKLRLWLIQQGGIPEGEHFLGGIVVALFRSGDLLLGLVVLCFSVVFPGLKIALCGMALIGERLLAPSKRDLVLYVLKSVGRWSMADVFIVAMIVVFFKAEGFHFRFHAGPGVYWYAASAVMSALSVELLSRSRVNGST